MVAVELMEAAPGEDTPSCWCEDLGDAGYICCLFECPGWEDYLGHITDTVEMAVGDVNLPDLPEFEMPDIPEVDDKQLPPPTTEEDPGLADASFDANDLKSGEPVEFREDPTGGFNIINPVENLEELEGQAPMPTLGDAAQPTQNNESNSDGQAQQPSDYDAAASRPSLGNSNGNAQQPSYDDTLTIPSYNP